MTRREHYANTNPEWDGTCCRCGNNYFDAALTGIRHGCLACLAQWQGEIRDGVWPFDDDPVDDPDYIESVSMIPII